ncbi:MAG: hypothetical protein IJ525_00625 [Alphaproteobacteria bacterium]|nr:hypothetical protein [Alphaproteobacteria bacterium]
MKNFDTKNIQINFNQAEDALTIPAESRHDHKCGSTTQSGRSMIEMLGVLAIIGVLSVGGIAGYSKAMQKYRINKTIEQITLIAGNVRAFFAPQRNYDDLSTNVIKKAKLVPDEMWDGGSDTNPVNAFGGNFVFSAENLTSASNISGSFVIMIDSIPQEACIEIATMDWRADSGNSVVNISVNGTMDETLAQYTDNCTDSAHNVCAKNMPMDIATASNACSSDENFIGIKFY